MRQAPPHQRQRENVFQIFGTKAVFLAQKSSVNFPQPPGPNEPPARLMRLNATSKCSCRAVGPPHVHNRIRQQVRIPP